MTEEQNNSKREIPYLTLVSYFLKNFKDIISLSDITGEFGDYLTDTTSMERIAMIDEHMPSPEDFSQKEYGYRESKDRKCIMDVSFYKGKLISFGSQMFFEGIITGNEPSDFIKSELLPLMNNILGEKNINIDKSTGNYFCSKYNGLLVTFSQLQKLPVVSVTIIEKAFF